MSNWWESNANAGDSWEASADAGWNEATSWDQSKTEATGAGDTNQSADAWGQKTDTWGSAGGGGGDHNSPPPAREYWEAQQWNKEGGVLSRKEEWELERDDTLLFDQSGRAQAGLNFSKYEQVPVDISGSKANAIPVCKTFLDIFTMFKDFMPQALEDNLKRCGYTTPTPVQKFAIPCGLVSRDVMCCAQTGSGKTAAFLIPSIGSMMKSHANPVGALEVPFEGPMKPDVLVITPTRELCVQIYEEALKCCHRTPYRVCRVYGGEKPKEQ